MRSTARRKCLDKTKYGDLSRANGARPLAIPKRSASLLVLAQRLVPPQETVAADYATFRNFNFGIRAFRN
jgi:hypothetical protein